MEVKVVCFGCTEKAMKLCIGERPVYRLVDALWVPRSVIHYESLPVYGKVSRLLIDYWWLEKNNLLE